MCMKLPPFVLFKQKISLFSRKFYLEFIQFIFLELKRYFFTLVLNDLLTNLSLFFDNSRKYSAIDFNYNLEKK